MSDRVAVRPEAAADLTAVREVNERAFGRTGEADIVDSLRGVAGAISLVAVVDGRVVGHVLFTPVTLEHKKKGMTGVGLAPLAVLPEFQKQGVGSALVRSGLEACRAAGHALVVVIGHPKYYPRFGFVTAIRHGFSSEYPVPPAAFMICELTPGALAAAFGLVKYRPEFAKA